VIEKIIWNKKAKERYAEKVNELCRKKGIASMELVTVEEKWEKLKSIVQRAMVKKRIKIKEKEIGYREWWDRRCTKGKRRLKKMYWRWRKGKIGRSRYLEKRKKFKTIQEIQKEKRTLEEEELKSMKSEADIWKFINKKRGARKWNDNDIEKEEWSRHFMELLEGEETEVKQGKRTEEVRRDMEKEIEAGEVRRAIKKLKVKKAAGVDGIPMEAWKYAGPELVKELVNLIKTVWKQGTLPSDWRKSIGAAV